MQTNYRVVLAVIVSGSLSGYIAGSTKTDIPTIRNTSSIGIQSSVEFQSEADGATVLLDVSTPSCDEPVVQIMRILDSDLNTVYESDPIEGECSSHLEHTLNNPGTYILEHHYGITVRHAAQSSSTSFTVGEDWSISRPNQDPTDIAIEG